MDEASITQYITDSFASVETVVASGDTYFFYGPEHKFPFATLVTSDIHDTVSNLNRPSVFRLNIGVGKETYRSLFGGGDPDGGHDFTALDRIMPHPVYGKMYWVCVLNPGAATLEVVKTLLAEAHRMAVEKDAKRGSPADEA